MSGYDAWRDREDQRLGKQGLGPYAVDEYADCACCGERLMLDDMHEVGGEGVTGVYLCCGCTEAGRRGELMTLDEARRMQRQSVAVALRSMAMAARVAR